MKTGVIYTLHFSQPVDTYETYLEFFKNDGNQKITHVVDHDDNQMPGCQLFFYTETNFFAFL